MRAVPLSQSQRRYEILPQMRDYDTLEEEKVWLPYVMTFQPPRRLTPSFTTDENGFRTTLWKGRPLSWETYRSSEYPRAALIGASVAFGVGASSDAFTLASLLNRAGSRVWFNFSGRAFNSTQELLIFLLYLTSDVKTVLIFSGVNNLVLSYLSRETSPIYNSFHSQSVFERGLRSGLVTGVRGSLRLLAREIISKLSIPLDGKSPFSNQDKYPHVVSCFHRDLQLWALLREAMGFQLHFVFQPIASWINKDFTLEEEEIFSILDQIDPTGSWDGLLAYLMGQKDRYRSDIRQVCQQLKVPFVDLNMNPSFTERRWLFADRAHLTDEGYRLTAEEIGRAFSL